MQSKHTYKDREERRLANLRFAREKAALWHRSDKLNRLKKIETEAEDIVKRIDLSNSDLLALALSLIYLCEGFKGDETRLGNSDPLILKFFIVCLQTVFNVPTSKINCELHLRADQDEEAVKRYWSQELGIPLEQFNKTSFDRRTIGSSTFDGYKGVCVISCGNVAIKRKLIYLSRKFCEQTVNARLAQLVEHRLDVTRVVGSIPTARTETI